MDAYHEGSTRAQQTELNQKCLLPWRRVGKICEFRPLHTSSTPSFVQHCLDSIELKLYDIMWIFWKDKTVFQQEKIVAQRTVV